MPNDTMLQLTLLDDRSFHCHGQVTGLNQMHRREAELCALAGALGIKIYQRSKTVWIAKGSYGGRSFEVKGRKPGPTLALWKEATRYRGSAI